MALTDTKIKNAVPKGNPTGLAIHMGCMLKCNQMAQSIGG